MNERFNKLVTIILRHEGGWVNDQDDPGGATNFGISLRFAKGTGNKGTFDIDKDGDIDADDIRKLSKSDAQDAYKAYFYDPLRIDEIKDEHLAAQFFDHAVNAGPKAAILILQATVGTKQDGVIGPKTIAAANTFINPGTFYATGRENFYKNLVVKNYRFKKYIKGWLNRVFNTQNSI